MWLHATACHARLVIQKHNICVFYSQINSLFVLPKSPLRCFLLYNVQNSAVSTLQSLHILLSTSVNLPVYCQAPCLCVLDLCELGDSVPVRWEEDWKQPNSSPCRMIYSYYIDVFVHCWFCIMLIIGRNIHYLLYFTLLYMRLFLWSALLWTDNTGCIPQIWSVVRV